MQSMQSVVVVMHVMYATYVLHAVHAMYFRKRVYDVLYVHIICIVLHIVNVRLHVCIHD